MRIADLHIHSRFSRATSKEGDTVHLDHWARRKGIHLVGTGDFTHPAWRQELAETLQPAEEGLYTLRPTLALPGSPGGEAPRFVITGEISNIYKRGGKTRKVHNLILLPSLEAAEALSHKLEAIGNIHSDGRPILGLDSRDLLEITLETCPGAVFIPAHIWTPHFALFGAFSGFDAIEECFGDLTPYIHALETGLSSDPPMNWRVSALDRFNLVSNSDAHSPNKLGREANLLDIDLSYPALARALEGGAAQGFRGTIEFFPEEGKYHFDGHRNCGQCLSPEEAEAVGGICPVCGKKLTVGVDHRVHQLADRPLGAKKENALPFESLAPLPEVIAASTGVSAAGKNTQALYEQMLHALGPEFSILREVPVEDIAHTAGPCVAEGIRRLRAGQVERRAGFDGEYGVISLLTPGEIARFSGQISLFGLDLPVRKSKPRRELKRVLAPEAAPAAPQPEALNPPQLEAVTSTAPVTAVTAGPGTGKTRTLVARIAWLVEERGVRPGEITAVTFTNQAAAEMRARLEQRLGGKRAVAAMTIGTFHAICLKLLGDVRLISPGEALTIAEQVLRESGRKGGGKTLLQAVSRVKNGVSPEDADLDAELYDAFQARLRDLGALDFDDLLTEGLKRDVTGLRCFRHVLVDEFQDINDIQYQLVRSWSRSGELFVIGDPDQSIYGFRGADCRCFQRLQEEHPGVKEIHLTENYRSAPAILDTALAVIGHNPGGGRILTPHCPAGPAVRLVQAADSFSEAVFIAKEIGRMTGGVDMLEAQALGHERTVRAFSDIAVLCRTHRQLELVEKCLRHDDIPCLVTGREDFLDDPAVRGALGFLRSLVVPADNAALESALRLLWNCPADLIQKAQTLCQKMGTLDSAALQEAVRGHGILENWLDRAEVWLPLVRTETPRKLVEQWEEQYGTSPALERLRNTAVFHEDFDSLWDALVLGQEADLRRASGKHWASGAVRLMTLHGAKGLEFPAVFLAGLSAGAMPLESPGRPADAEEERRLFFVGLTRAREDLILTAAPEFSPFLRELPETVVRETTGRRREAEQLRLF